MFAVFFAALKKEFIDRVWTSYETALIGAGIATVDATLYALDALALPSWGHGIIGAVSFLFLMWKQNRAKASPAASGFSKLGVLLGLIVVLGGCAWLQKSVVVAKSEVEQCGSDLAESYAKVQAAFKTPGFAPILAAIPVSLRTLQCLVDAYIAAEQEFARMQAEQSTVNVRLDSADPDSPLARAVAWRATHP